MGLRVGDRLGISPEDVRHLEPLASQDFGDEERRRVAHLGKNGTRDVAGKTMTHCVPNEHVEVG